MIPTVSKLEKESSILRVHLYMYFPVQYNTVIVLFRWTSLQISLEYDYDKACNILIISLFYTVSAVTGVPVVQSAPHRHVERMDRAVAEPND